MPPDVPYEALHIAGKSQSSPVKGVSGACTWPLRRSERTHRVQIRLFRAGAVGLGFQRAILLFNQHSFSGDQSGRVGLGEVSGGFTMIEESISRRRLLSL